MLLEHVKPKELALEEITSADRAEALRPEWSALWERCPAATPFQTPEWQLAWWNAFAAGKNLWILVLREPQSNRVVALLPACLLQEERKVLFLGAAVSDELDLLAEREFAEPAARIFLTHIVDQQYRWNVCEFQPLPECSPLRAGTGVHDISTFIELSKPLPPNMRRNLKRYARRAEKFGAIRFETAEESNFDELFDALLDLHRARWNRREQPGLIRDDSVEAFHAAATRALLHRGILRFHALRLNERIVACWYGFACSDRMLAYFTGFDPEFAQVSPGTLLVAHAIREAKREGAREFSFLRGAESYKRLWGARNRYLYSRRITATTPDAR